jgi:membrane-associated HD superfamily phosphohydrolase
MELVFMGSEPIENEENKVLFIVGWLGWIGVIVLAVMGEKRAEDKQLQFLFYQMLMLCIIMTVGFVLSFTIIGYFVGLVFAIIIFVGFIISLTGKLWIAPVGGKWAAKKVEGE